MILTVLICILSVVDCQRIQVTTVEGTVEGYKAIEVDFYTFYGISYATVGSDKFQPSTPVSNITGLAYGNDNITCAHPGPKNMIGFTECLVLNVFTSNVTASKPVLVWLNGEESNPTVSSHYSFKRLIDEDIVVVTLNYRLSVFGFLCLRTEQHPGNAGLKDIILGLQWIQRNIAVFGGNPSNVVLMGHGSAAVMVDLITLTPQSKNLVHKAIALSGSAIAPGAVSNDPIRAALTLNRYLGGGSQSIDKIPVFLSSKSLKEINDALNQFKYAHNTPMFAPCVEKTNFQGEILTDAPINLLTAGGHYNDIPYIAGYVTREGTQRAKEAVSDGWLERMQTNFTNFLPVDLNPGKMTSQAENIRKFYFHGGPINISSIDSYFLYHGDTMVVVPMIRGLRERSNTSVSEVRLLELGYIGTKNSDWNLDYEKIPLHGARHGSFLNYIYDFDLQGYDEDVANSIVKRISAFAHTGTPNSDANDIKWKPFATGSSYSYLSYSGTKKTEKNRINPQEATMSFWNPLYLNDNWNLSNDIRNPLSAILDNTSTSSGIDVGKVMPVIVLLCFIFLIIYCYCLHM